MKKPTFGFAHLFILLAILVNGAHAHAADSLVNLKQLPSKASSMKRAKPKLVPKPPKLAAKAYILIDVDSGKILAEKNASKRLAPASLTKMLTMYVVSDAITEGRLSLKDKVSVSKKAWKTGGSRMFVKEGEQVPVAELIKGVIVQSGNDACVALAEHVAGSESAFTDLMNHTAESLGMTGSHFTDSTGMPHDNHYTTPRDMAILGRAIIKNHPDYYRWYKQKWYTHNGIRQPNRNRLLWRDTTVDGIKTGHTNEAGYCLVSSALRDNMRLLAVVMGAPTDEARAKDSASLLNYGFRFFETHKLYKANQVMDRPRVWLGAKANVPIGLEEDLTVTIPHGEYKNLDAVLEVQKRIQAPIKKDQVLGELQLKLNGDIIVTRPLRALADSPKGGLWTRMKDRVKLSLYRWFGVEGEG